MLSNLEKYILFYTHEANRCRFFGYEEEYVENLEKAIALERIRNYAELTKDEYVQTLRERLQGQYKRMDCFYTRPSDNSNAR